MARRWYREASYGQQEVGESDNHYSIVVMLFRDFPLQGSITYEQIDEAHTRLLKVAIEVRNVLERHCIPYSLFFGSVIGAVRHKGFVPWDLDMDFGVFNDYEGTVQVLKRELPPWLVVLDNEADPNYCASWVKIVDRYSEFHATTFGGDNDFKFRGLHVDLYNIIQTTYNEAPSYRRNEAIGYYERKYLAGMLSEVDYKALCAKVKSVYQKEVAERDRVSPDRPVYAFLKFFEGESDTIFPLKEYEFEGEFFLGPNDYDLFLKCCYYKGDYMQMPPYEQRDMKMDQIFIRPIPEM